MSFNAAAFELLMQAGQLKDKDNVWIQFLYDPENKIIGFKPVAPETADSYPVRKQPRSESYLVTGKGFVAYFGLEAAANRRYPLRVVENGIVGFSLSEGGDLASEK